jgi:hypothetical protein
MPRTIDGSITNFYLSTCLAVNSFLGKPRIKETEINSIGIPLVTVVDTGAMDENLHPQRTFTNPRLEIFLNFNNLERCLKEFHEFTKTTLKNNNSDDYKPTIKYLSQVYKNIISTYGSSSSESFQLMKENLFQLLSSIQATNANKDMKSDLKDELKTTLAKSLQELNKFQHKNILQQNDILNGNSNFIKAYDGEIYHGSTTYHEVLYSNANSKVPLEAKVKIKASSGETLSYDKGLYGDGVYFSPTLKSATGYAKYYSMLFDREAVISSHPLTKEQRLFDSRFERAFVKALSKDPSKLFDEKNSEWTNQNLAIYQKFLKQYQGWLSSKLKESIIIKLKESMITNTVLDHKVNGCSINDTYNGRSNEELWGSQKISKTLIGVQENLEIIDKVIKNSDKEVLESLRGLKNVSRVSPQLIGEYCSELGFNGVIGAESADWQTNLDRHVFPVFESLSELETSVTEGKLAVKDIKFIKDVHKKMQKYLEKQPEHYESLDIRHYYLKELIQFIENRSVDKPDQDLVLSKRDDEYLKHLLKKFSYYDTDRFNLMINLFDRGDGIPVEKYDSC